MNTKNVTISGLRSGSSILIDGNEVEIIMVDKSNRYNPTAALTLRDHKGISNITDSTLFNRIKY